MNINYKIMKKATGWSSSSWGYPLKKIIERNKLKDYRKVLELGAGKYSAISMIFLNKDTQINMTTYEKSNIVHLRRFVRKNFDNKDLINNINFSSMSALSIEGKYDIIILKSVLGGIFRTNSKNSGNADILLKKIAKNHLNKNGFVISLDNGRTIFENLFKKFGARKNSWRFFIASDFPGAFDQITFGFLSNFSLSTRLGRIGHYFDHIIYLIDRLIFCIFKIKKPSIIISIYRAKEKN